MHVKVDVGVCQGGRCSCGCEAALHCESGGQIFELNKRTRLWRKRGSALASASAVYPGCWMNLSNSSRSAHVWCEMAHDRRCSLLKGEIISIFLANR